MISTQFFNEAMCTDQYVEVLRYLHFASDAKILIKILDNLLHICQMY